VAELKRITGVRDVSEADDNGWKILSLRVESGTDLRADVFRLARDRHWEVRELTARRATLEDVFVELTHSDET